ncbi:phasin family protein [Nitrincola alkalilacustris]|uniref:phasin family protein n=1 Tax=Nitrincola alkalilacustris TaxID=1571224 RepID=UPI00124EFBF0|nr:phasin family protein [Nitrincola alkalilacustris]
MFQDMTKHITDSMEPFKDLVNIQTKMLEDLTRQQMECTKACIEATMQQTKELQNCKTPADLMALQQAYAKGLEETLRSANEHNLQAVNDAREAIEKLTKGAMDSITGKK